MSGKRDDGPDLMELVVIRFCYLVAGLFAGYFYVGAAFGLF